MIAITTRSSISVNPAEARKTRRIVTRPFHTMKQTLETCALPGILWQPAAARQAEASHGPDVARTRALSAAAIFNNFELDVLPLLQGVECAVGDSGNVKKDVAFPRIRGNEPKPAVLHEFLDGALWHVPNPLIKKRC